MKRQVKNNAGKGAREKNVLFHTSLGLLLAVRRAKSSAFALFSNKVLPSATQYYIASN